MRRHAAWMSQVGQGLQHNILKDPGTLVIYQGL